MKTTKVDEVRRSDMRGFDVRITRRRFLEGMALAAGSAAFAGCGEVPGAGGDITFLNWEATKGTPLSEVIKKFEQESGKKVNIQPVPGGDTYDTKVQTLLASGRPPDIFRINDDYVRGFSRDNYLLNLNKYMKGDFDKSEYFTDAFEFATQPDGKHTAWVLGFQPRLMFYNKSAFEEAGVDLPPSEWTGDGWTWDDFVEISKQLTVEGERWGALVYLDTGYEQTFTVNNGSPTGIYSEDGKEFTLADPKAIEAVQWATDLTCEHGVQPPWSELQRDDIANQLFVQGRLAMMYNVMGVVPYLRGAVKDFEWDVAPVPANVDQKTESSLIVFSIPREAQNPDDAWELLKFLASPEAGEILAKGSQFIPINRGSAEFIKPGDQPPANLQLFAEAANNLTQPNQTNNTSRARDIYRPELEAVYNCNKTAEEVLNNVRPEVERALAEKF
jgi:multiple sugar transport system substrate-binding protein